MIKAQIGADLTWDAVARKYLEMFEEARRSGGWRVGRRVEGRGARVDGRIIWGFSKRRSAYAAPE
jgi:hypothetical protein